MSLALSCHKFTGPLSTFYGTDMRVDSFQSRSISNKEDEVVMFERVSSEFSAETVSTLSGIMIFSAILLL